MESYIESPSNLGFIIFDKNPSKYKYEIKESGDIISRGNIHMDDTFILEGVRSAVAIEFELAGDDYSYVTFRTIKNSVTVEKLTAHSLLNYPTGSVILPGVRKTYSKKSAQDTRWLIRITIKLDT